MPIAAAAVLLLAAGLISGARLFGGGTDGGEVSGSGSGEEGSGGIVRLRVTYPYMEGISDISELEEVQEAVKDVPEEERVRAFVLDTFNGNEIYTTSSGLESNLIQLAGGENVTRGMSDARWFNTSAETLVETNPDVIILNDYGAQTIEEKIDFLNSNPAFQEVKAVKNQAYLVVPLVAVMQDVRAASACRTFAEYFYPECFS